MRIVTPSQLLVAVALMALLVAGLSLVSSAGSAGEVNASTIGTLPNSEPSSQAASQQGEEVAIPVLIEVALDEGTALPELAAAPTTATKPTAAAADAATNEQPATTAAPTTTAAPATTAAPTTAAPEAAAISEPPKEDPPKEPDPKPASNPDEPTIGAIKSKADDKGYDVHGHVEHSVALLGEQVLIPGQAATGGFIQTDENTYVAYSPVTAMLPVAIQDNKEVLEKKPNLEGEQLYRRLAQEYTGSNDYKNLDKDAQRAINILTCTDWSKVDKKIRENTINHLLHSPISFGVIGSVENPISTDVTIDLGYTHTRDKNWTEVEYMGNNVYKITVVSNNNNGSHTGHAMGTAYVEMPAGTTLKQAQKIGNKMIPSKNKNNKLTIDPAAKELFDTLPRGASPMILFEHLSEEEQNAFFEGRGVETVGQPNPDCNPLDGGILSPVAPPAEETTEAPAEDQTQPAEDEGQPADGNDGSEDNNNDDQSADKNSQDDTQPADNMSDENNEQSADSDSQSDDTMSDENNEQSAGSDNQSADNNDPQTEDGPAKDPD